MKKRRIMIIAGALVVTAFALTKLQTMTAYAVEGWISEGEEWRYLDENDEPLQNTWRQSRDSWFYLGNQGIMLRDCFIDQGNSLYYVFEDGSRAENTWILADEADGNGHEAGWYYFGASGKAYRGTSSSFKRTVDGRSYIFDESGRMLTGWFDEDGNPLDEDDNPLEEGMYYADEDGALKTESWLDYSQLELRGLEDLSSDISGRDYDEYDQVWLYFNNRSKKVKSNGDRLVQKNIDGSTYGFDEYGIMLPWWTKVASVSNADKSNPTSDMPAKFFAGYDGGSLLKNSWFWMYPSDNLIQDDYDDGEYSWWRTDQNGNIYQDKIKKVNGRYYAFDGLGRMQTGFVLFDTRSTFVAQYDMDAWSSEDFIEGNIYGIEKADLYFFSPDELNDGSMQTGSELKVELEDGVYTFGFKSNGVAYGNRNRLKRVKDSYYINGLRLEADEEYGYGVVRDGEDSYRVVNANGKTVTGNKKVVKDKDGGWLIIINSRFAARVDDEFKPRWHKGEEGTGFYHYDSDNKEDKYAGGLIAGSGTAPLLDGLPEEERLNF
uniref:cell surface protein n=1 Tax=Enterocloster aldenensis TaxID=358742 RepID=UPI0036F20BA0